MSERPPKDGDELKREVEQLRERVDRLESRLDDLPETDLLSESFLTRAFTVLGHYITAGMVIYIPFVVIFVLIGLLIIGLGIE